LLPGGVVYVHSGIVSAWEHMGRIIESAQEGCTHIG
jgi:hypothetical protein